MIDLYLHHRGGFYVSLGVATDSTNGIGDNLYRVYYSLRDKALRVRLELEFTEPVTWPDGVVRPRFEEMLGRGEFPK